MKLKRTLTAAVLVACSLPLVVSCGDEKATGSSSSVEASEQPTLPPHHMDKSSFDKLALPYLKSWVGAMSEPNTALNIVDRTNCKKGVDDAACPHILIVNLDSDYGRTEYGNDPVNNIAAPIKCVENNSTTYGDPALQGKVSVGGVQADYYEQAICPQGFPEHTNHIWYVKSKGMVVMAADVSEGKVGLPGLRAALEHIQWQPAA